MNNNTGYTRDLLLKLLKEHGRLTVGQIEEELQLPRSTVSPMIKRAKKAKQIRIAGWYRRYNVGGPAWIAQYGLGANPDVSKPEPESQAERSARSYQKHRAKVLAKSRKTVNPLLDLLR